MEFKNNLQKEFLVACRSNDAIKLEELIQQYYDNENYYDYNEPFNTKALHSLCFHGNLNVIKWLVLHFQYPTSDICEYGLVPCCVEGHLESAKWLVQYFELQKISNYNIDLIVYHTLRDNHHHVFKWFVVYFDLQIEDLLRHDNFPLRYLCETGNLEMVAWLMHRYKYTTADLSMRTNMGYSAFSNICSYAHIPILEFCIKRFESIPEDRINDNSYINHVIIKRWKKVMIKSCLLQNAFVVAWLIDHFPNEEILLNDIPEDCKEFVQKILDDNDILIKPAGKYSIE